MKNKNRHWLLVINFIAILSIVTGTIVQLSFGAMEILAAPKELSLSSEKPLTDLVAGDEFVVTISDSREASDIATTENTEVPLVDKSTDISSTMDSSASLTRQWTIVLPEGISFDKTAEEDMLKEADAEAVMPTFAYDEETRELDISVEASVTELELKLLADLAGEYDLSVADTNIAKTDSEKLEVVVGEDDAEVAEVATEEESASGLADTIAAAGNAVKSVVAPEAASADDVAPVEAGRTSRGFTTVPDSNGDYANELTYSHWGGTDNTWGDEPADSSQVIHVYNFSQLQRALQKTFTNNGEVDQFDGISYYSKRNASYIKFMNNIDNGNRTAGLGLGDMYEISNANARNVVIDGNGFYLSTGLRWFRWGAGALQTSASSARSVYIKNIDMYSQSPYGCFSIWFTSHSSMIYENVTYTGSQLSASYLTTQVFRGNNRITNVNSFTHPAGGTCNAHNANVSSGLEGRRVYVQTGSNTVFDTAVGDGVILGAYYSRYVTSNVPILHLENGARLDIKARGNGGESYGDLPDLYGATSGTVFSAVNIQDGGALTLAEGAVMDVDTSGTGRAGIYLTGGNKNDNGRYTTVDVGKNAKINVLTDGNMGTYQTGPWAQSTTTSTNYQLYAGLSMYDYSKINLSAEGAELNINMKNDRFMWTNSGQFSPGIYMGTNSSIDIAGGAAMNLNMDGSFGSCLRMNGANSTFNVADDGSANFTVSNQTGTAYYGNTATLHEIAGGSNYTTPSTLLYVNTGTFRIGRRGNFTMKVNDGTGVRSMLYANTGTFRFADANKVDLDAQANDNVQLINMAGTFIADIQVVYGWNKGNTGITTDDADYTWAPIYNANIPYTRNGSTITTGNITVNSIDEAIATSFRNNYKTENFNRVLYEFVPDVTVDIDEVSDNETQLNGQRISGVTNPDSFVAIYVTPISTGTRSPLTALSDSGQNDVNNVMVQYNTTSDASGNYSLNIPAGTTLYVGDTITVRSFRWGKEKTETSIVLDQTPPEATTKTYYTYLGDTAPVASDFITGITDKGVASTTGYPVAYNASTDINALMATEGTKQVSIDVSDLAVNSAGAAAPNTGTVTANLVVYANATGISADTPIEFSYADIRNMSDTELSTHILNNSNPTAYSIADGVRTEWNTPTDFTVTNLGSLAGLTGLLPNTDYPVEITLPTNTSGLSTALSTTINVRIINMNAVLTIEFADEAGTVLPGYTLTAGEANTNDIVTPLYVGDTVNLNSPTFQAVQDQLDALKTAGYEIGTQTVDPSAVVITDTTQTYRYTVTGQLFLQSAPANVDFGTITYNSKVQRVDNPSPDNDLVVTDTRANKTNGWTLYAALSSDMRNTSTGSIMSEALRYVKTGGDEITLNSGNQPIYNTTAGGTYDVTSDWGATSTDPGLKLVADPTKTTVSNIGSYTGVITWTIVAGQP